jgi:AcrR family transcriptional regulator
VPDRKTAILDAAISVIARDGVRGVPVEEIAASAGVAVSLLYYYFDTRDGLVRAALDHATERVLEMPARADGRHGHRAVERMLLAELDESPQVRETSVVRGEVLAAAVFDPDLRDQLRAANEAWVSLIADRIREGQSDGSIGSDLDARACAERLTALVDSLSSRWLAGLLARDRARDLLARSIDEELRPGAVAGTATAVPA